MTMHLKNMKTTTLGKIEILENGWDKMVGILGQNMKDKYTKVVAEKLMTLNPKVKRAALSKYVQQCNLLHHIAFYNWRLKYRTVDPGKI